MQWRDLLFMYFEKERVDYAGLWRRVLGGKYDGTNTIDRQDKLARHHENLALII